jgi:hypothetical protein
MFSLGRACLLVGVACGLGMTVLGGGESRAESITMTIVANGVTIPVDPLILSGADSQNYGTVDLTTLNSLLIGAGSAYQFSALGGSSNWSGAPDGGVLNLSGGIFIPKGATGSTDLTITESEDGFISPSGSTGSLASTSTGNFGGASPGDSHDASSSYTGMGPVTAGPYTLTTATGNGGENGAAAAGIPTFVTPYSLQNFISFHLTPSGITTPTDGFSVNAIVTANPAVPEPTSIITMALGLPLPLVLYLAWLRRRHAVGTV